MVGHEKTAGMLSFSPSKSLRNRIRYQQDTLCYDYYRSAYTMKSLHMDTTWATMMRRSSSGSLRVSLPSTCLLSIPNLRILYHLPSFLTSHSFPTSSTRQSRPYPLLAPAFSGKISGNLSHIPNQTNLTPIYRLHLLPSSHKPFTERVASKTTCCPSTGLSREDGKNSSGI